MIVTLMKKRPRFDYSKSYFVESYKNEKMLIEAQLNLLKAVSNSQIDDERAFVQKVSRDHDTKLFGLPFKIIPIQNISVNTGSPVLQHVYMLEFHPCLGIINRLPKAIQISIDELKHVHNIQTTSEEVKMETRFYQIALKQWESLPAVGSAFSVQIQRDLFCDIFIEDPLFVCEVGESSTTTSDMKGSKKNMKDDLRKSLVSWGRLLSVITTRHRLIEAAVESDIITSIYRNFARQMGFDDCHAFLRAVSFEFAQSKPESELRPLTLGQILDDDSAIDR